MVSRVFPRVLMRVFPELSLDYLVWKRTACSNCHLRDQISVEVAQISSSNIEYMETRASRQWWRSEV